MNRFRKDINGLRAWAVVAVVLFHFGVPGFTGGFVGVDVFFVISGFLMTGIVVGKLETPDRAASWKLDVLDFYLARARRILPALAVLCATLIAAGWFALGPLDYAQLATHAAAALVFLSNFQFWREAGYFDIQAHEKLLLHTWSLSVEWQFCLVLPLVLLVIWKIRPGRKFLGAAILAGFAASLFLSVALTPRATSASFYLLPTRAWELLAGSLAYLHQDRNTLSRAGNGILELLGFLLIAFSIAAFDGADPWPGWRAFIPVLGTALVILSRNGGSPLSTTRAAQWLGKTSYSIYLWHWPLCVALVYTGTQGQAVPTLAAIALSLALGWLSWKLVEEPGRQSLAGQPRARQFADRRNLPYEITLCGSASVLVPFTPPGPAMAREMKRKITLWQDRYKGTPKVILLQNHGMITLGESVDEVMMVTEMTLKFAEIFLGAAMMGGPEFLKPIHVSLIEATRMV